VQHLQLCACRKLSLLVHPDKCSHEQAPAAFEVIGEAQKFILDADRREGLMRVLEYAREAVRTTRRKATKNDSALRMAAALHAEGRAGVEKEWEETDDFHEKWRVKSQDVLARSEFRRRKLLKRCDFPLLAEFCFAT
jgi:DnaJ homolog subfamily C member 8